MITSELCKGCGACQAVCPTDALLLTNNSNGFDIPRVDMSKCVHCELCEKACTYTQKDIFNNQYEQIALACRSRNIKFSNSSRSGGAFRTIADYYIREYNGIVYGAAKRGTHIYYERVVDAEKLFELSGSKYVWCDHTAHLKLIGEDLKKGHHVLVSGLPCQIAAVYSYLDILKINKEKLLTCDIVCHGCPSPKLYNDYLIHQKNRYHNEILAIDFRNKHDFGWKAHIETLTFAKRKVHSDIWTKIFYSHLGLRNSCFYCQYKSLRRVGDVSLADCWNIEKTKSQFNDDKGTSLILVNNANGRNIIETTKNRLLFESVEIVDFMQPALKKSVDKPAEYDVFWKDYECSGFEYVLKKYIKYDIKKKLRFIIKIAYYRFKKMGKAK